MKRHALLLCAALLALPCQAFAGPDDFICDTAIYGGETALVKPNVLIIFDTSGSMGEQIDTQVCVPNPDQDGDGINDIDDNCAFIANANQADADNDGVGGACDNDTVWPDTDGDGVPDKDDNCPADANPDQADSNNNDLGDVCDSGGSTGAYDPSKDYTKGISIEYCGKFKDGEYEEKCKKDAVYYCKAGDWNNGSCDQWKKVEDAVSDIDCSGTDVDKDARKSLNDTGRYTTSKYKIEDGCDDTDKTRYYATGNWIVWYNMTGGGTTFNRGPLPTELYANMSVGEPDLPAAATAATSAAMICTTVRESKNSIARKVVEDLIRSTDGVNFGVMQFNNTGGNVSDSKGAKFITRTVDGVSYTSMIKDMPPKLCTTCTKTNEDALVEIVKNMPASGYTPLGESMYEAMRYLTGGTSAFSAWTGNYPTPINASCQQNYIIFMTDGMSTADDSNVLTSICGNGDCDKDGNSAKSDSMDDIAYYLNRTDLSSTYAGTQNALTFTIGFGLGGADADAVQLLEDTAANGGGKAYLASNYQTLVGALTSIIGQILEVNSSFVAPVVPTNPENKTYSGKRLYLGFFKPISNNDWKGNLKKFGLNATGDVVDKNNVVATDANGRFLATATSYWSTNSDGSNVDEGGVGELLATRDFSTSPRLIYTYTGTQRDLTHASNRVAIDNGSLSAGLLQVATADERTAIINYVTGFDAYDADFDGNTVERRDWLLGDILHSKPAIQAYTRYTLADESDSTKNSSVIYIGSNDGQIHAFSDADGSELWSFIPPSVLQNLKYLGNNIHDYYMDGSPRVFVYDYDRDGNIGPGPEAAAGDTDPRGSDDGSNDKVVMLIGMRRGGGIDTLQPMPSRGSYYALDITNPQSPVLMWELNSTTTGFGELGETWSAAEFGQVRTATPTDSVVRDRLVAYIGAGYDNNDDLRFGDTQTFPGCADQVSTAGIAACNDTETTLRADDVTLLASPGTLPQWNSRGRGIYVVELATIDGNGVPTFNTSPVKLWDWTFASPLPTGRAAADNPTYAFPTNVIPIDRNYDGLDDLIYAGDTGGNMWRFNVKSQSTANWFGKKVFTANPSDATNSVESPATNGRKIMDPPSVVFEPGYNGLYFGTGDRAHPLNEGVTDRLYAFYDRDYFGTTTTVKTEANLVNVTTDLLQVASPQADSGSACTATDLSLRCQIERLASPSNFGWFIKLDQRGGEKALSPPVVFNKVAYFTTYTPDVVTTDPCLSGNLGQGRKYVVHYKTGEAVFNFDLTNDDELASNTNDRAAGTGYEGSSSTTTSTTTDSSGTTTTTTTITSTAEQTPTHVLRRSDREEAMGSGIPSGMVIFIREDGTVGALAGNDGGVNKSPVPPGGLTFPIYWMQE